ncbi:hypothetical protein D3C77_610730 [compost metagenome]
MGEIVATSPTMLRISLWENTTTTRNIMRSGQATLVAFSNNAACYIQLALTKLPDLPNAKHPRTRFAAEIVSSREDIAKYADITSGVRIQLKDSAEVIERWEQVLQELFQD